MSELKDKMTPENVNKNSCITEHVTPEDTVQGSEDWDIAEQIDCGEIFWLFKVNLRAE